MSDTNNTKNDLRPFKEIPGIKIPRIFPKLSTVLIILFIFLIGCLFLPWIQTSKGTGNITTLTPKDRLQKIIAPVSGRVVKWYVRDGSYVHKGDKVLEISNIDPRNIERLKNEISANQTRLDASKIATRLALKNKRRQTRLFREGLVSRRKMELSDISYQKALGEQKYYQTLLIKAKAMLRKQDNQWIYANREGYITKTLASSKTLIVKPGDVLATFVPDAKDIAAAIYVSGMDIPLIRVGQRVRLIFDGWPSVQFSGWPSVSIGTFPGIVKVVDYAASRNGLFRVIVMQDPKSGVDWPNKVYLRLGTKTYGYIQMNRVSLGFELWRQLNGFPISINNEQNNFQIDGVDSKSRENRLYNK